MAIIYMESSLATSEIFNSTLNSSGNEGQLPILQQVKEYILDPETKQLNEEDLEAPFITLRHTVEPLTQKAIQAFINGDIVLLQNIGSKNKTINKALPFITLKRQGKNTTYIFMDSYLTVGRLGLNVPTANLRDLLIGAFLANELHNNYNKLANNEAIKNIMMEVYMKLFINVLNRQYTLMSNKPLIECIQYWVNRFFLTKIYGGSDSPEAIESLAKQYFRVTTDLQYIDYKRQYDQANIENVTGLLNLIKTLSMRMEGEDTYKFIITWNNYYYPTALLAIDDIEYLLFMTLSSYSGNGNMINIGASTFINDVKNIKNLRSELAKIM